MSKNLTIQLKEQKQEILFEDKITGVYLDGEKLNDVHDLTGQVIRMTRITKTLAISATFLALIAVLAIFYICNWLLNHEASIEELLLTSSQEYSDIKRHSENWRSHKRHRAYVTLNHVLGYRWNESSMEWEPPLLTENNNIDIDPYDKKYN